MDKNLLNENDKVSRWKLMKLRIFSRLPSSIKVYILFLTGLCLCFYIYYCLFPYLFYQNHFDPLHGTTSKPCPACFGNKACEDFYIGEINIKGAYRLPFIQKWKSRPIFESFRGLYSLQTEVILKKLATQAEFERIDTWICDKLLYRNEDGICYAKYAIWFHLENYPNKSMPLGHLAQTKNISPMMHCVTDRLFERIRLRYSERDTSEIKSALSRPHEVMLIYTLHVNQQPLMLQLFPKEDGWPFPKYYGACGRWMVEGNSGTSLDEHCQTQIWKKATILFNLLTLPMKLDRSNNKSEEWVVYIGDPDMENFMVNPVTLNVEIVDLEHMLVVDVRRIREMKLENSHIPFKVPSKPCGHDTLENYFNCSQSFDKDQLCGHESSDHNIHSICAMLLAYNGDHRAPNCLISDQRFKRVHQLLEQCVLDVGHRRAHADSLLAELKYIIESVRKTDL